MQHAIDETNRRRKIQTDYNKKHNITPFTVTKKISDIRDETRKVINQASKKGNSKKQDLKLIKELEKEMQKAASNLEFELAAVLRDQINDLKEKTKSIR